MIDIKDANERILQLQVEREELRKEIARLNALVVELKTGFLVDHLKRPTD